MDKGDPVLNVPTYNGGLFNTTPGRHPTIRRASGIARFLVEHKVPDRYLALAIDRLARDQDEQDARRWSSSTTSRSKSATWARSTKGCWSSSSRSPRRT